MRAIGSRSIISLSLRTALTTSIFRFFFLGQTANPSTSRPLLLPKSHVSYRTLVEIDRGACVPVPAELRFTSNFNVSTFASDWLHKNSDFDSLRQKNTKLRREVHRIFTCLMHTLISSKCEATMILRAGTFWHGEIADHFRHQDFAHSHCCTHRSCT